MKKEILDWYAGKSLEIHKQVELGAVFNLSQHQIEAAMEHCYKKIVHERKPVPDNQIAWYVRNVAKDIDVSGVVEEHALIEKAKDLKKEIEYLDRRIRAEKVLSKRVISKLKSNKLKFNVEIKKNGLRFEREMSLKDDEIRRVKNTYEAKISTTKTSKEALKRRYEAEIFRIREEYKKNINERLGSVAAVWAKEKRLSATIIYILILTTLSHMGFWLI